MVEPKWSCHYYLWANLHWWLWLAATRNLNQPPTTTDFDTSWHSSTPKVFLLHIFDSHLHVNWMAIKVGHIIARLIDESRWNAKQMITRVFSFILVLPMSGWLRILNQSTIKQIELLMWSWHPFLHCNAFESQNNTVHITFVVVFMIMIIISPICRFVTRV